MSYKKVFIQVTLNQKKCNIVKFYDVSVIIMLIFCKLLHGKICQ
jgi:hypothetical protein